MSTSRRHILRGLAPLLVGLAGCASSRREGPGGDGSADSSVDPGSVSDPATVRLRNTGDAVLQDSGEAGIGLGRQIVASRERREAIEFAPGVPDEQVAAAEEFLDATTFGEESVYLLRQRLESCTRHRIRSISWDASGVDYEYCWELRPSDVACEADESDRVVTLVRIPAPLDQGVVSSTGSHGTGCEDTDIEYDTITVDGQEADR